MSLVNALPISSANTKSSLSEILQRLLGLVIVGGLSIALLSTDSAQARDRHDLRQDAQRARVQEGRHSGEFTRSEARRLRHSAGAVRRAERRAEADGQVDSNEARRLERLQDRRSRQIHRMKHNERSREGSTGANQGSSSGLANSDTGAQ